jgi:hypothetical protein
VHLIWHLVWTCFLAPSSWLVFFLVLLPWGSKPSFWGNPIWLPGLDALGCWTNKLLPGGCQSVYILAYLVLNAYYWTVPAHWFRRLCSGGTEEAKTSETNRLYSGPYVDKAQQLFGSLHTASKKPRCPDWHEAVFLQNDSPMLTRFPLVSAATQIHGSLSSFHDGPRDNSVLRLILWPICGPRVRALGHQAWC